MQFSCGACLSETLLIFGSRFVVRRRTGSIRDRDVFVWRAVNAVEMLHIAALGHCHGIGTGSTSRALGAKPGGLLGIARS